MAAQLSNPAVYSQVRDELLKQGYKEDQINKALGKRVAFEQAPAAIEAGLPLSEAVGAAGGLGTPGITSLFEGVSQLDEEKVGSIRALASQLNLLEEQRKRISFPFRGRVRIGAKIGRTFESDIEPFEGLRESVSFSLANAIADQIGRALSDLEREGLKRGLPAIEDTDAEARRKIQLLASQMKIKLLQGGVSEEDAEQFAQTFLSEINLDGKMDGEAEAVARIDGEPVAAAALSGGGEFPEGALVSELPEDRVVAGEALGEEKTLAGFGENILTDISDNIEGIVGIPGLVQQMIEDPGSAPGIGKAIVTGVVEEYKELLANPAEKFYNHPVNTILDVIPLIPVAKAGKARFARLARATGKVEDITDVAKAARGAADIAPEARVAARTLEAPGATRIAQKGIAERVTGALPSRQELAVRTYKTAFVVPHKLYRRLRPIETSAKMMEYGLFGDFKDLKRWAGVVTGRDGVLAKVTRNAIGKIKEHVDIGRTAESARNILDDIADLTSREQNRVIQNIIRTERPAVFTTGMGAQTQVLRMNPLDAFDLARRLEKLGWQHRNANTYLTKNLKADGIGKAYLGASDEIMASLEKIVKGEDIMSKFKTPEILDELRSVSPGLADDFLKAKTLSDVRGLQAPFVRMSQMVELTLEGALSPFRSMGGQIAGKAGAAAIGAVAGSSFGPLGTIAGGVTGTMFGPTLEAVVEALRPSIVTKTAKFIGGK